MPLRPLLHQRPLSPSSQPSPSTPPLRVVTAHITSSIRLPIPLHHDTLHLRSPSSIQPTISSSFNQHLPSLLQPPFLPSIRAASQPSIHLSPPPFTAKPPPLHFPSLNKQPSPCTSILSVTSTSPFSRASATHHYPPFLLYFFTNNQQPIYLSTFRLHAPLHHCLRPGSSPPAAHNPHPFFLHFLSSFFLFSIAKSAQLHSLFHPSPQPLCRPSSPLFFRLTRRLHPSPFISTASPPSTNSFSSVSQMDGYFF